MCSPSSNWLCDVTASNNTKLLMAGEQFVQCAAGWSHLTCLTSKGRLGSWGYNGQFTPSPHALGMESTCSQLFSVCSLQTWASSVRHCFAMRAVSFDDLADVLTAALQASARRTRCRTRACSG
jgi:alpha-tubulin suppressor-like RCC1 family protein